MSQRIELRIGELTLQGFRPVSGHRVAAAAKRHLATLVAKGGLDGLELHSGTSRLPGGHVEVSNRAGSTEIGRAVARAVYEGLTS